MNESVGRPSGTQAFKNKKYIQSGGWRYQVYEKFVLIFDNEQASDDEISTQKIILRKWEIDYESLFPSELE